MTTIGIALLAALSLLGFTPANPQNSSHDQTLVQTSVARTRHEGTAGLKQAPARTATQPPVPASKAVPVKAKIKSAPLCSRQTTANHDAQLIPPANKVHWRKPGFSAKQQRCQVKKPSLRPPHR